MCNVTMVTVALWQVRYSPSVGRYLVAARDIRPLELVLWDAAAAVGPSADREAVLGHDTGQIASAIICHLSTISVTTACIKNDL